MDKEIFSPQLEFEDKSVQDALKILREKKRDSFEISPANLGLYLESGKLFLIATNGNIKKYPVRKSFFYKLLRWYSFPISQLKYLGTETAISVANDYLLNIKADQVRIITEDDDALTITSLMYTDIPDLKLIELCSEFGLSTVTRNDFFLRVYSEIKEKKEPFVGDVFGFGFNILSSDTGFRTISVSNYLLRYICSNGAYVADTKNQFRLSRVNISEELIFQSIKNNLNYLKEKEKDLLELLTEMKNYNAENSYENIRNEIKAILGKKRTDSFFGDWDNEEFRKNLTKYDLFNFLTDSAKKFRINVRFRIEEIAGKMLY